jgi:hypothetical protein
VCLAIPVRFLLAAGEHLPEPSHRAAHVPRSCCRNGRMRQKEKQALNGWMQMQGRNWLGSNETTETELVLQRGNSREINSGFLESYTTLCGCRGPKAGSFQPLVETKGCIF